MSVLPSSSIPATWALAGSVTGPTSPPGIAKMDQICLIPALLATYAMVTFNSNPGWIAVADISNAASPHYVGLPTNIIESPGGANNGPIYGVISGNYFYVGTNPGYIYVINITNPAAISAETLTFRVDSSNIGGIFVSGNKLYATGLNTGKFYVISVSNPVSPTLLSTTTVSGNAVGLAVSNSFAYIADYDNEQIVSYNVSNGVVLAGTCSLTSNPGYVGLHPNGNTLYVTSYGSNILWIVDIMTPGSPSLVATLTPPGGGSFGGGSPSVQFQASLAYIGNSQGTYTVYSVVNPESPVFLTTTSSSGATSTSSFAVDNQNNIYVPNRSNISPGGSILDILSPTSYSVVTDSITPQNSVSIAASISSPSGVLISSSGSQVFVWNNIVGNSPAVSGEAASQVIVVSVSNPLVLPGAPWSLSAVVANGSIPGTVTVTVTYTNDSGSAQTFPTSFNLDFIVAYL